MRKTDISDYSDYSDISEPAKGENKVADAAGTAVKGTLLLVWRVILTLLMILVVAGIIIGVSMVIYVASIAREPTGIDLHSAKLNETSYIYTYDKNGENPELVRYQKR